MKPSIYTSIERDLACVQAIGHKYEDRGGVRILVSQYVHAGNKPVMNKGVELVLSEDETLILASQLLAALPLSFAERLKDGTHEERIRLIKTFIKVWDMVLP